MLYRLVRWISLKDVVARKIETKKLCCYVFVANAVFNLVFDSQQHLIYVWWRRLLL